MRARRSASLSRCRRDAYGVCQFEVLVTDVRQVRCEMPQPEPECGLPAGTQPQPPGTQLPTTLLNTPDPPSNPLLSIDIPQTVAVGKGVSVGVLLGVSVGTTAVFVGVLLGVLLALSRVCWCITWRVRRYFSCVRRRITGVFVGTIAVFVGVLLGVSVGATTVFVGVLVGVLVAVGVQELWQCA